MPVTESIRQMVERIDLWFRHVPDGTKRQRSVLHRGVIRARSGLLVSSPVPSAMADGTGLETWLNLDFSAENVESCGEEPRFSVVRLRGEGGKFAGSQRMQAT